MLSEHWREFHFGQGTSADQHFPQPLRSRPEEGLDLPQREPQELQSQDLLEANHVFPGEFPLTVIALNSDEVTAALLRSVAEGLPAPLPVDARDSRLWLPGRPDEATA